ncbi:hypothetical protein HB943_14130 [Listeria weihenstephanensis]|uniref:Lipoprotein n=1 Tax=Listeria weihenstephanensis TaxID=1006155 RepID=A0A841ZAW0_9LIST|nr:hypothetical protein [Listeria weihenstephanensis]MBC1501742.1 hypothetical protein [Listeria weihenstephanensis]
MKKAIIALALIVLSVALFLTACTSPKSEFMSSFRNTVKNKQFTTLMTLQPTAISGFEELNQLNPDALTASNITVKTSRDSERDLTYNTFGVHVGGVPTMDVTAHSLQNGSTGKIFVPVNDFFQTATPVTNLLDLATNSVFSKVLAENEDLKDKQLDLLQTWQNVTNQVIDEKTVDEQADQLQAIEGKTAFLIYENLNKLDKSHYQTENGTIKLTLSKKELAELANAWLEEFRSNRDFISFYANVSGLKESQAKESWNATSSDMQETLKALIQNKNIQLNTVMTLHPDADKGIKKLIMSVDYANQENHQKLKFDFTMELRDFEKIPESPNKSDIVTKKELDTVMTDVIQAQRK